jgi:uncharacterized protein YjbJ (UPF0337 family)
MGDIKNKAEDLKGRAKEAAGDLKDDDELEAEGKLDRASGGLKDKIDDIADKAEDAVERVKERIKDR